MGGVYVVFGHHPCPVSVQTFLHSASLSGFWHSVIPTSFSFLMFLLPYIYVQPQTRLQFTVLIHGQSRRLGLVSYSEDCLGLRSSTGLHMCHLYTNILTLSFVFYMHQVNRWWKRCWMPRGPAVFPSSRISIFPSATHCMIPTAGALATSPSCETVTILAQDTAPTIPGCSSTRSLHGSTDDSCIV